MFNCRTIFVLLCVFTTSNIAFSMKRSEPDTAPDNAQLIPERLQNIADNLISAQNNSPPRDRLMAIENLVFIFKIIPLDKKYQQLTVDFLANNNFANDIDCVNSLYNYLINFIKNDANFNDFKFVFIQSKSSKDRLVIEKLHNTVFSLANTHRIASDIPYHLLDLAAVLFTQKQYKNACSTFEVARRGFFQTGSTPLALYFYMGLSYALNKDYKNAAIFLSTYIEKMAAVGKDVRQSSLATLKNLSTIFLMAEQFDKAAEYYDALLNQYKIQPPANPHHVLISVYADAVFSHLMSPQQNQQNIVKANEYYASCQKLYEELYGKNPQAVPADMHSYLGFLSLLLNKFNEAEQFFIKSASNNLFIELYLGYCHHRMNKDASGKIKIFLKRIAAELKDEKLHAGLKDVWFKKFASQFEDHILLLIKNLNIGDAEEKAAIDSYLVVTGIKQGYLELGHKFFTVDKESAIKNYLAYVKKNQNVAASIYERISVLYEENEDFEEAAIYKFHAIKAEIAEGGEKNTDELNQLANKFYDFARRSLHEEEYDSAIKYFKRGIEVHNLAEISIPHDIHTSLAFACEHSDQEDPSLTEGFMQSAVDTMYKNNTDVNNNIEINLKAARECLSQKNFVPAIQYYQMVVMTTKALKQRVADEIYDELISAYTSNFDFHNALNMLNEKIDEQKKEGKPEDAATCLSAAEISLKANYNWIADEWFGKYLAINGVSEEKLSAEDYRRLGHDYYDQGLSYITIYCYKKMLNLQRNTSSSSAVNHVDVWYLVNLALEKQLFELADEYCEKIEKEVGFIDSLTSKQLLDLGYIKYEVRKNDQAENYFKKYIDKVNFKSWLELPECEECYRSAMHMVFPSEQNGTPYSEWLYAGASIDY